MEQKRNQEGEYKPVQSSTPQPAGTEKPVTPRPTPTEQPDTRESHDKK